MSTHTVVWNATICEQAELLSAIEHNCGCRFDKRRGLRIRTSSCSAHDMLVHDQRALNTLLWTRRQRQRLLGEEGIAARG